MSAKEARTCPTCGHEATAYWHPVTKGLVQALIKVRRAVIAKGDYSIHTSRDMNGTPYELTKMEYSNFTKLRYHGLVAKDDSKGKGYWILTRRGAKFLKGEISIPEKVKTLNNEVLDRSLGRVNVKDVLAGDVLMWVEIENLEREAQPLDVAQPRLI